MLDAMTADYRLWPALVPLVCASAIAQSQPTTRPVYHSAIAAWFDADTPREGTLAAAVRATLDGGKPAIRHLAKHVTRALARDPVPRERVELVLRDVAVQFHDRARAGGMFFAGQYAALEPLQPYVGRIYLQLVTDTPDWFPLAYRPAIVVALRDLFPDGPGAQSVAELRAIATDEEVEQPDVRLALACAFAQWGDRALIAPRLGELTESAGQSLTADELYFTRKLAYLHYELREYPDAADAWTRYLRGKEALEDAPLPLDYYNAACAMSLAGHIPEAFAELERCAALLRSDSTDESHRIERRLFEEDPELRAVRPTRRFQELVERAFERSPR